MAIRVDVLEALDARISAEPRELHPDLDDEAAIEHAEDRQATPRVRVVFAEEDDLLVPVPVEVVRLRGRCREAHTRVTMRDVGSVQREREPPVGRDPHRARALARVPRGDRREGLPIDALDYAVPAAGEEQRRRLDLLPRVDAGREEIVGRHPPRWLTATGEERADEGQPCNAFEMPRPGLYRTTIAHPLQPDAFPADVLVYVGSRDDGEFVVRPHANENNRWFWRDPVTPLGDADWGASLKPLPAEGFYTLPEKLEFDGGGIWLANAIVQLGYDRAGRAILFVAERRETIEANALFFSNRGKRIDDELLARLQWAPILPVPDSPEAPLRH